MVPSEMEEGISNNEKNDEHSKNLLETASIGSFGSIDSLICEDDDFEKEIQKKKKYKRGVVYISFIPPSMNPTILRRLLSEYGIVERIYLQPKLKKGKKLQKNMKNVKFTEGWVEFLKKRDAKHIASLLNNTPIGGKKKSKFREYLWNLKYLPRFKWIHLCERLNYERAVKQQRLRAEVSQAKKIANHFAETVDKEERQKRRKGPKPTPQSDEILEKRFKQKRTKEDEEEKKKTEEKREDFLKNLFG